VQLGVCIIIELYSWLGIFQDCVLGVRVLNLA